MSFGWVVPLIIHYRYWILFPLACFEGPIVAIIIGFLTSLGYFDAMAAYAVMIFGDIVPDTAYFYIGRYGKRESLIKRYGHKVGLTEARFEKILGLWKTHPIKTMVIGKLAYGLSIPVLISAGLASVPPYLFYLYAVPVTFFQYGVLMYLGYTFGASYGFVATSFTDIQIALVALVIIGGCYYGFTVLMRRRLLREK